jgi:hypothetical protein
VKAFGAARTGTPVWTAFAVVGALGVVVAVSSSAELFGAGAVAVVQHRPGRIAAAIVAYLIGHVLRVTRTSIVLGAHLRSLRLIVVAHMVSAPWGLLPLKLGEVVRMWAAGRATSGFGMGLGAVWVERTFDAAILLVIAGSVAYTNPAATMAVLPVAALSIFLLLFTSIAAFALPENLAMAKLWVIRRQSTSWSVPVLRVLDDLGEALTALRSLIRGKVATLGGLTLAIWTAEVIGVGFLAADVDTLGGIVPTFSVVTEVLSPLGDIDPSVMTWRGIVFGTLVGMALIGSVASAAAQWGKRA